MVMDNGQWVAVANNTINNTNTNTRTKTKYYFYRSLLIIVKFSLTESLGLYKI